MCGGKPGQQTADNSGQVADALDINADTGSRRRQHFLRQRAATDPPEFAEKNPNQRWEQEGRIGKNRLIEKDGTKQENMAERGNGMRKSGFSL